MAVVVRDEIIDGVPYRITEDEETGFYSKVCLIEGEIPEPEPNLVDRVKQLEDENAFLKASTQRAEAIASATSSDFEAFMDFFFSQF